MGTFVQLFRLEPQTEKKTRPIAINRVRFANCGGSTYGLTDGPTDGPIKRLKESRTRD